MLLIHAISYWEKRWWRNGANQSPPSNFILRHVNTDSSNDGGGGGSTDARHTNSMKAYNSTDMAGNNHRDSTHIHNPDSQTQFRPKPEHQNAAREQKRIPRPPMQLREVFSSSLFYPHRDWCNYASRPYLANTS